ncbi:MAG: amino acid permease, partial [Alphaproteobacteria bacterium]|nr:amino acid permease [Alphaproteobacteria bacterium]
FFPPYFKGGNSWEAILVASAILWIMNWLVLRGIRGVVALNVVATIAKLIPVIAFLFVVAISMKAGMWGSDLWGTQVSHPASHTHLGSVLDQVKSTMLVTLWVYIGIEGAVVMSETSDERTVGRATILGFAVVTTLYVLSSILPFGIMTQAQLSPLDPPAAAAIMDTLMGRWASNFINVGVIISNLACWLVWTILVAELPYAGAKDGTYPKVFATTNQNGSPSVSLWVSTAAMQAMIILVYFATNAWNVMLSIAGVMILPAYIGSSGYLWRLLASGEYPSTARFSRKSAWTYSILATVYGVWLVYAAGLSYMLAGAVFFALGNAIFFWARREHAAEEKPFLSRELIAAVALFVVGVLGAWMLVTGRLPEVYKP